MVFDDFSDREEILHADLQVVLRDCDVDLSIEQIEALLQLLDEAGSIEKAREVLNRIDRSA